MTPRSVPAPRMFVTVTPNPSLDRTVALPHLVRGEVHRAQSVRIDPGGKGVNVARALASAGHRTVALMPSGATPGERLAALLEPTDVTTVAVPITEATRVNITLVEPDGVTTKINEPGPRLSADEVEALMDRACALGAGATWLVGCGSLPRASATTSTPSWSGAAAGPACGSPSTPRTRRCTTPSRRPPTS